MLNNAVGLAGGVFPAAGMALGLGTQIFGAIKGSQAAKANQTLLDKQTADNESFYNNRVNQDFLGTNAAKGIFEKLRENTLQANKQIENKAAVTGGTAEAEIAAKGNVQENYNDSVGNLAQNATAYQSNAERTYMGQKNNLVNAQMQINEQKSENAANLASNAGELVKGAATLTGFEGVANKQPILGRTEAQDASLKAISLQGSSLGTPSLNRLMQPKTLSPFDAHAQKIPLSSVGETFVPDYETPLNYGG